MITHGVEVIPSLLLPVEKRMLLLPTAAIAEIIPYKKPEVEILPDVPAWFVGMLNWRGTQIPLAILENMKSYVEWEGNLEPKLETGNKCHIAIINRITKINSNIEVQKFRQYPFFSIILQGAPKLIRIFREALKTNDKNKVADPRFIMEVKLEEGDALLPNLDTCWKIIDTLPSRLQWLGKIVRRGGGSR